MEFTAEQVEQVVVMLARELCVIASRQGMTMEEAVVFLARVSEQMAGQGLMLMAAAHVMAARMIADEVRKGADVSGVPAVNVGERAPDSRAN